VEIDKELYSDKLQKLLPLNNTCGFSNEPMVGQGILKGEVSLYSCCLTGLESAA